MEIQHAADRAPVYCGSDARDLTEGTDSVSQLDLSWNRSARLHADFRQALVDASLPDSIVTVAVSGSFGRMEVVTGSDCDLIVVLTDDALRDTAGPGSNKGSQYLTPVFNAIRPLGLSASKAGGIFSMPTSVGRLCDSGSLGVVDEAMETFGHRIQLLIDSQPIYGRNEFIRLQRSILQRYASETIEFDSQKQWTCLLNDLIRYHRSLCVRTQWATRLQPAKWRLLNLKLCHSRLMNYAGLLLLLGECSRETNDKISWLLNRLPLTPLERVTHVLQCHGESSAASLIVECYDRFLSAMNDSRFLGDLAIDGSTGCFDDDTNPLAAGCYGGADFPDDHAAYQILRDNSRRMISALTRFLVNQPDGWAPQFHELLLF